VSSGTDALILALKAVGVGEGDEVITAANTFVATAEAIAHVGARPVFVDIQPDTYNIDPEQVKAHLTHHTKAVIPVHLYGHPVDMEPLLELAREHDLYLIEDASQAHGASYQGRKVGTLGDLGCFSFYPSKNLGAFGDAGCIVTNDLSLAATVRKLRNHGEAVKHRHEVVGFNKRMDALQAAVVNAKLKYLDQWNEYRQRCAQLYDRLLGGIPGVVVPYAAEYGTHVYHLYVIRVSRAIRGELQAYLQQEGVVTGVHYPRPVHRTEAFAHLRWAKCPLAEKYAHEIVSLPMYPGLTGEQITLVTRTISDCLGRETKQLVLKGGL
jgi:dTDP-4-amino-4,6-dideoxygalactose transaminase